MDGPTTAAARASAARAARGPATALALVLLAGLALRVAAALGRSLWLDEFHTLFHARALGSGAFLAGLVRDNHPPLSFALTAIGRALFGESELALRLPALLAGLGAVALAARAAQRIAGPVAALGAAVVAAFSGLALQTQSEARMYALLALAVAGLLEALAARASGAAPRLPWRASLWVAVGLLAHYWFVHHLALFALAGALAWWSVGRPRPTARDLAPIGLGLLLASPWYATGFLEQLTGHELAPGGRDPSLGRLAQSYLVLLLYQLGRLPGALGAALAAVGAVALAASLWGALVALRDRRPPHRLFAAALVANAFLIGPLGFAAALVFTRAGFNWTYLAGAVPPLAVGFGLALARLAPGPRRALLSSVAAALAIGAVPLAVGPGTEDLRGAVRAVLAEAGPEDGVLAVEWQPGLFPHGQAWSHYAAGVDAARRPRRIEHGAAYELLTPEAALPERLFVVRRGLPLDAPLLERLRRLYRDQRSTDFGWGVSVERFEGRRSATDGPAGR